MKQKIEKIQEITTNIHRLGMALQLINEWEWNNNNTDFENDIDFRLIHTSLLLTTGDDRLDNPKIFSMTKEDIRSLMLKIHYEYLDKWRKELVLL